MLPWGVRATDSTVWKEGCMCMCAHVYVHTHVARVCMHMCAHLGVHARVLQVYGFACTCACAGVCMHVHEQRCSHSLLQGPGSMASCSVMLCEGPGSRYPGPHGTECASGALLTVSPDSPGHPVAALMLLSEASC